MRSASPPRDGPDSDYDGNKRQTTHTRLPPNNRTYCLLIPRAVVILQNIQTLSDATFLCLSVARPIENAHWNQSDRNSINKRTDLANIALTKPTGWRQLMQYFSPFGLYSPSFLLLFFKQHVGDPAGYNRQFNWACLLAQSVHLHLHTDHTEH